MGSKLYTLLVLWAVLLASCTTVNRQARMFGGTQTVVLGDNERLINITWKGNDLWLLVEDTTTKELTFREQSQYGILQGNVKIK